MGDRHRPQIQLLIKSVEKSARRTREHGSFFFILWRRLGVGENREKG